MKKKLIVVSVISAMLINFDVNSMQKKDLKDCFAEMKAESKAKLDNSHAGSNAKVIAKNMIDSVGIDAIVKDKDFYATSYRAHQNIEFSHNENPSTCEEIKILLPYALRYQVVKKIEELQGAAACSYRNSLNEDS